MLKVGCSEVDITPPLGVRMAGYFEEHFVEAIRDPLFARAMVIDSGSTQLCFITCDVLSVKTSMVGKARAQIHERTGMAPECIAISATHNHFGPAAAKLWTEDLKPDPDYLDTLERGIVEAACQAHEKREPATVGIGWAFEGKLSFNRRYIMRDGKALMHPPPGSTDILYQEGPVDPEVGVLCVRGRTGDALGYVVNFACHATVSSTGNTVTADFPGHLAAAVKSQRGDDCVTLFTNGCCANLCQQDVYDPDRPRKGPELAAMMGERLAEHAATLEADMTFAGELALDARTVVVPMPVRHIPDELVEWAKGVQAAPDSYDLKDRRYAAMTFELAQEKRDKPMTDAEVQAFRLGDVGWVMLPGEIFVEFGLDIKLRSPGKRTFVTEMANGVVGYVPTKRAFEGGAYETRTANSSRLAPVAGEMMVETAHALLDSMFR